MRDIAAGQLAGAARMLGWVQSHFPRRRRVVTPPARYDDNGSRHINCAGVRARGITPVEQARPACAHMGAPDGDGVVREVN